MSIPINIPTQAVCRPRSPWDSSPFPEDEGPYMGYTETFEKYVKFYPALPRLYF
jgi:hypothetical protein